MDPLIDCGSRFLQRNVLATAEDVEWTDWGCQILAAEYERAYGSYHAREVEFLSEMPAAGDKRNDWIALAFHDNQIKRVTFTRSVGVHRTAQVCSELRF